MLFPDQRAACDRLTTEVDSNLLLCGLTGSGKSHTIREFVQGLSRSSNVAVTAMTCGSAISLDCSTLNGYLSSGRVSESTTVDSLLEEVSNSETSMSQIKRLGTLIIDDANTLSAHFLDLLDGLFRHVRKIERPLGGVRLILVGDFLQLPPVVDLFYNGKRLPLSDGYQKIGRSFCFQSKVWKGLDLQGIYLHGYRRGGNLQVIVKEIAEGNPSEHTLLALRSRSTVLDGFFSKFMGKRPDETEGKMVICGHRSRAEKINKMLVYGTCKTQPDGAPPPPPPRLYAATTTPPMTPSADSDEEERKEQKFRFRRDVELRVSSRVRVLKTGRVLASRDSKFLGPNQVNKEIVVRNGSLGWVHSFVNEKTQLLKRHIGLMGEFPVENTMAVEVQLEEAKSYIFVGLADEEAKEYGSTWDRVQIPLEAAYASTTHKVQGCEFKQVIIAMADLNNLFTGQLLCAISRVRHLEDLYIDSELTIDQAKFLPHIEVKKFYSETFPRVKFAWSDDPTLTHALGAKRSFQAIA